MQHYVDLHDQAQQTKFLNFKHTILLPFKFLNIYDLCAIIWVQLFIDTLIS